MKERWKQITGFNYKVSNFGRVRSLDKFQDFPLFAKGNRSGDKISLTPILRKGKELMLIKNNQGYLCVGLYKDKKRYYKLVHRLVAETFLSDKGQNTQINHVDSDKQNNKLDNLEWCTPLENMLHTSLVGTHSKLSRSVFVNNSKLSKENITDIFTYKKNNPKIPNRVIADKYGVSRRSIDRLLKGQSYKWLT